MRVCLGIPIGNSIVPGEVYHSHLNLVYRIAKHPEVNGFVLPAVLGIFPHDRAREAVLDDAIRTECDYLFFLDADMHPQPNTFHALLAVMQQTGAVMTCGHAYRRGFPFTPVWTKLLNGEAHQVTAPFGSEPDEIDASGLACNLIDMKWCRENLERPWFYQGPYQDGNIWEDAFFCKNIRAKGGKIFAVPGVRCGHLSSGVIVNDGNHNQLRKWHMEADRVIE